MARTTILASATAVLAAAAVGAGVIGSPVGSAGAAAPFSITKSQYNQVRTNASKALQKSNANAKAIRDLKIATVTGVQGPKGDPGSAGGLDPAKLVRVPGPVVPVSSDSDYVSYSLDCPPGTVVLSGGQSMSTGNEKAFRVVNSYPQSDLSGWTFRWAYSTGAGQSVNVTPHLVCVAPS
ncbi:MAG: hypothetical protein AB7O78_00580 [Thermoleophilia bacterium]